MDIYGSVHIYNSNAKYNSNLISLGSIHKSIDKFDLNSLINNRNYVLKNGQYAITLDDYKLYYYNSVGKSWTKFNNYDISQNKPIRILTDDCVISSEDHGKVLINLGITKDITLILPLITDFIDITIVQFESYKINIKTDNERNIINSIYNEINLTSVGSVNFIHLIGIIYNWIVGGKSDAFELSCVPSSIIIDGGNIGVSSGSYDYLFRSIDYYDISNASDSLLFGNLTFGRDRIGAMSTGLNNRGIFGPGCLYYCSTFDYVNISTPGDAVTFGECNYNLNDDATRSCTDNGINHRGIIVGGNGTYGLQIQYIATNILSNSDLFGTLLYSRNWSALLSNDINNKGLILFGSELTTSIESINIRSLGNAVDFGSASHIGSGKSATSNGINNIGIIGGTSHDIYSMSSIAISTNSDSVYFGDLSTNLVDGDATSNKIRNRAVFCNFGNIEYVNIVQLSNSSFFGNLTYNSGGHGCCSNS